MKSFFFNMLVMSVVLTTGCAPGAPDPEQSRSANPAAEKGYGLFAFQLEVELPGSPTAVFDLITGDISGWWDHSFAEEPYRLFIEPRPGGGFWEYFDESGNGVLHATVIAADRGRLLRFDGPLGLAGKAIQMVTTYTFTGMENGQTKLVVDVHASGELDPGIDKIVESVWRHFIFEQFQPYCEEKLGQHKSE